jgi:hypothetical protein
MDHFYNSIEGMFTFPDWYRECVTNAKDGDVFVELGSWKGASSSCMAVEIANSNKKIDFVCVDSFEGDTGLKSCGFSSEGQLNFFLDNMKPVEGFYRYIQSDSSKAADLFENESVDLVFIDAEHTYDSVKKDILSWLPKIKKGGTISGHDFMAGHEGVERAVFECFDKNSVQSRPNPECVWIVKL